MQIPTEHEANVFGQLDTYAKKIERTFHVTLIERNGEIKIMGEEGTGDSGKASGTVPQRECDYRTERKLSHLACNGG